MRIDVLARLFPVRADKLGKIEDVHTSVLRQGILRGEIKTVLDVPESGVICTKRWVNGRWHKIK